MIRLNRIPATFAVLAVASILVSCSAEHEELRQWMEQQRRDATQVEDFDLPWEIFGGIQRPMDAHAIGDYKKRIVMVCTVFTGRKGYSGFAQGNDVIHIGLWNLGGFGAL